MSTQRPQSPYAPGPRDPQGPPGRAASSGWRDLDPETPDPELLARHGARLLDPLTATRLPGQPPIRFTVYVADSLIVPQQVMDDDGQRELLRQSAAALGLAVSGLEPSPPANGAPRAAGNDPKDPKDPNDPNNSDGDQAPTPRWAPAHVVRLVPAGTDPVDAPDAWKVLQHFRALAAADRRGVAGVGLNHLLFGEPHVAGHPVVGLPHVAGHSVTDPDGLAEYALAGSGGREPVTWLGAAPDFDSACTGRRPVVAVLDTGCGDHPWFGEGIEKDVVYDGVHAGSIDPATDPEITGDLVGPMDGVLDTHSGHGTFITGLIRQICPQATVLAIRIMASDGVVEEGDLIRALSVLDRIVADSVAAGDPPAVDVVSLSLGYYHEIPADVDFDPVLLGVLQSLGRNGVAVIAGAGNDATVREMYPAAFLPHAGGVVPAFDASCIPVVSVGALNPDGTIALFSNGGSWVASWEVGAALVSTFPVTFNGGVQPTIVVRTPTGRPRATIDPDSFRSGFGTWSGTSFSTPVLAARLAKVLMTQADSVVATDDVARMWAALHDVTGLSRPDA